MYIHVTNRRKMFRRTQWRWAAFARNLKIVAVSGESYNNKQDCLDAISLLRDEFSTASLHIDVE